MPHCFRHLGWAFLIALLSSVTALAASAPEEALWGKEPVEASTAKRGEVCLNGVWRFAPVATSATTQPTGHWGAIRVPGDWRNTPARPGIVRQGSDHAWAGFKGDDVSLAWYERTFVVPREWQGRAILVDFGRVSTDAIVYVNGRKCGTVAWPTGSVDITDAVKPGDKATLRVLVAATTDDNEAKEFRDKGERKALKNRSSLESRGLIGDVILRSRPKGAHIRDVFVQTSTREKMVIIDVEIAGMKKTGIATLVARMLDEKGNEEKRFERIVGLEAKGAQIVSAAWRWEDPRLWDFGKPNLYTVKVEAHGHELEDEYAQSFGFREFWIEGRKFFLNGTEFRLRPNVGLEQWSNVAGTAEVIDGLIDGQMKAGFNIEEHWPIAINQRGTPNYRELRAERADLKGWPLMGGLVRVNEYLFDSSYKFIWREHDNKKKWEAAMLADMKRMRNHPSILLWSTSANLLGFGQDQNPKMLARMDWTNPSESGARAWRYTREAVDLVKQHDPTRPVFNHQGGYVGDLQAINMYLCLLPLQEREEWPSYWAAKGQAPFMAIEFGTPLHCTLMRGRADFAQAVRTEPLMTEFCAIYFGKEAYTLEPKAYREQIKSHFVKDQEYRNWHGNPALETAPAFQKLQELFSTKTWRSWRTWGVTGGMVPWSLGHGWSRGPEYDKAVSLAPFQPGRRGTYAEKVCSGEINYLQAPAWNLQPGGKALIANNGETLAWIAGPKEALTAKDHNFTAGDRVRKQIVIINDARQTQDYAYAWAVSVGDKTIARGQDKGRIGPAGTLFFPLEFEIPADTPADTKGEIRLLAELGAARESTFSFRVFPKAPPPQEELVIFDPVGHTAKMLQQQGYQIRQWKGETDVPMVLVGWKVISRGNELPGDLEEYVRDGGRAVVFAQNRDWMRKTLAFRVAEHLPRRVFPVASDHPAIKGLEAVDLCDWAGESTLIEARPDYLKSAVKMGPHGVPYYGWHWGNRGAVSSGAIEKPHRSGWRPILECEFDLAYSPLMELDYGKGRLIWCTLDLEDHVALDPAAGQVLRQLLTYARTAPLRPRAGTVLLLGDDADAARASALGVICRRADQVDPAADLLILGAGANYDAGQLRAYLEAGGKAFFLARKPEQAALGVKMKHVPAFGGSLDVPAWEECAGLSASDLRWRSEAPADLVVSGGEVGAGGLLSRLAVGKGVALVCQIDPDALNADQQTYFRYTRWRQTRAMAQILANLGASFAADARAFAFDDPAQASGDGKAASLYHPDYRDDFERGDDPYRYFRW